MLVSQLWPQEIIYKFFPECQYSGTVQAVASEGATDDAKRRGEAFSRAFRAHLARLVSRDPTLYF